MQNVTSVPEAERAHFANKAWAEREQADSSGLIKSFLAQFKATTVTTVMIMVKIMGIMMTESGLAHMMSLAVWTQPRFVSEFVVDGTEWYQCRSQFPSWGPSPIRLKTTE